MNGSIGTEKKYHAGDENYAQKQNRERDELHRHSEGETDREHHDAKEKKGRYGLNHHNLLGSIRHLGGMKVEYLWHNRKRFDVTYENCTQRTTYHSVAIGYDADLSWKRWESPPEESKIHDDRKYTGPSVHRK